MKRKHDLRYDGSKLTGHREILVSGAVEEEKILKSLDGDLTNFVQTDVAVPFVHQT